MKLQDSKQHQQHGHDGIRKEGIPRIIRIVPGGRGCREAKQEQLMLVFSWTIICYYSWQVRFYWFLDCSIEYWFISKCFKWCGRHLGNAILKGGIWMNGYVDGWINQICIIFTGHHNEDCRAVPVSFHHCLRATSKCAKNTINHTLCCNAVAVNWGWLFFLFSLLSHKD